MNTAKDPGPRPAPNLIKFTADCFVQIGETTTYVVARSTNFGGPAVYTNRADAEAFAKRSNREVIESVSPLMHRVKWL